MGVYILLELISQMVNGKIKINDIQVRQTARNKVQKARNESADNTQGKISVEMAEMKIHHTNWS